MTRKPHPMIKSVSFTKDDRQDEIDRLRAVNAELIETLEHTLPYLTAGRLAEAIASIDKANKIMQFRDRAALIKAKE